MSEPVVLTCLGCGRRATATHLTGEQLRELTGYRVIEGQDWCGECAAALRTHAELIEDLSPRPG